MLKINNKDLNENAYDYVYNKMLECVKDDTTADDIKHKYKLIAYEAYNDGLITLEEREELILSLINKQYFENDDNKAIPCTSFEIDVDRYTKEDGYELSNREIFDSIKKELYHRYESGEITLDQREAILSSARTKYLVENI